MKKFLAILLAVLLCIAASYPALPAYAAETTPYDSSCQIQRSTTSIRGPLKGAVQHGSPVKCSSHKNLNNAAAVMSFLALISGVPASQYASGSALVLGILANNTTDQYYTRTEYYSSDGTMFYYKYTYYKNSDYTGYIDTDYSYVYSLLY